MLYPWSVLPLRWHSISATLRRSAGKNISWSTKSDGFIFNLLTIVWVISRPITDGLYGLYLPGVDFQTGKYYPAAYVQVRLPAVLPDSSHADSPGRPCHGNRPTGHRRASAGWCDFRIPDGIN